MDAALDLVHARPAAGASVLAVVHRAGARPAADRAVALFDQGVALQTLMNGNAEKLLDRAARGVLSGSGDNR